MIACEFLLVRHASSQGQGRFLGHSDVGLAPQAAAELRPLAMALQEEAVDLAVSSDLRRCRETAARLLSGHAVRFDRAWRECDSGAWTLASHAELLAGPDGARYQAWLDDPDGHPPPAGEGLGDCHRRIARAADDLARAHPGGRVLVITHAGPIGYLLAATGDARAHASLPPAGWHRCSWPPRRATMKGPER